MPKEKVIRFSISLPENLLGELDSRVIKKGYASRSEYVRDLIREQMIQDKWLSKKSKVVGVLSIIYDHHQKELAYRLTEVQHNSHINVLCSTHLHLDHHNCLETIMLQGNPEEIEKLAITVGGLRGIQYSKLTRAGSMEAKEDHQH